MRKLLESILPDWDETLDWSLFLERESYSALAITSVLASVLMMVRFLLAPRADLRLQVPGFHFRQHFLQAPSAFMTPEIE